MESLNNEIISMVDESKENKSSSISDDISKLKTPNQQFKFFQKHELYSGTFKDFASAMNKNPNRVQVLLKEKCPFEIVNGEFLELEYSAADGNTGVASVTAPSSDKKKVLGMSVPVAIGVGISIAVAITGAVIIYHKRKNKQGGK